MSDPTYLPIGTWLSSRQYCIEKHLGAGGFGKTYLVKSRLGKQMVVKEFFISTMCTRDDKYNVTISVEANRKTYDEQRRKFEDEALLINKLNHPNIVKASAIFEENNTIYYVMEYVEGESLSDKLKRESCFTEQQIRHYLHQLLDALEHIHSLKPVAMMHLDIKPGNIMIDKDDNVVLIDFGASKLFNSQSVNKTLMSSNCPPYTPGYAPLEQENGDINDIGPHCDIYAVGATLFRLFTLENPPSPYKVMSKGLPQIPNASPQMQNVIKKAMEVDVNRRIQSVAEFRALLDDKSIVPNPPEPTPPVPHSEPIPIVPRPEPTPSPVLINVKSKMREALGKIVSYLKKTLKWLCIIVAILGISYLGLFAYYHLRPQQKFNAITPTGVEMETYNINGHSFNMIKVDGGTFDMGSPWIDWLLYKLDISNWEDYVSLGETPIHSVTLSDYYIGETEVTQGLWEAVMNYEGRAANGEYMYRHVGGPWLGDYEPSGSGKGLNYPAYYVSYDDIVNIFIPRLNKITGKEFRLPTEAEWEYAARGGNKSRGCKYSGSDYFDEVAWNETNSSSTTHPVGTKSPNELGIRDMSGNVCEWCSDWYDEDYYSSSPSSNPTGPASGSHRVLRGGSWCYTAQNCRVANRASFSPGDRFCLNGFRLALFP